MASWEEIEAAAPQLAAEARELLDGHVHKTIATLRRDGSPRISGIEARFVDADLWVGSMPGSRKGEDLLRDPRFALHSGSDDPPDWRGDAKLAGRVEEVTDHERRVAVFRAMGAEQVDPDSVLYRLDIDELTVTRLNAAGDELEIEHWSAAGGLCRLTRK